MGTPRQQKMLEFESIGEELEARWLKEGYDEKIFPQLAEDALNAAQLVEKVDLWEIAGWAIKQTFLPEQRDLNGRFGDPPLTLFNAPRFHIDIYYWLEGTTSIHQHGFCGAFQVLHGSSIHSRYGFKTRAEIGSMVRAGELEMEACELLSLGSIKQIDAGEGFIHSLFHLEQPSATIVIRTHSIPLALPQFSYFKPGLAINPFFEEPNTVKKVQLISSAIRSGLEGADAMLIDLLKRSDLHTSFTVLSNLRSLLIKPELKDVFGIRPAGERFQSAIEAVCETHPDHGDLFKAVFEEYGRVDEIVDLRRIVTDVDHRYFLALLLNVEGRDDIFALIKQRYPESDPMEKTLDWISELANTKVLDGAFPNALGIEGFTDWDAAVLEELFGGKSDEEIADALKEIAGAEEGLEERVRESLARIRGANVLKALL